MAVAEALKQLDLTADQQKLTDGMVATYNQDLKNFTQEHAAEVTSLQDEATKARQSGDQEALKAIRAKQAALAAQRETLVTNLLKQLESVLSGDQMAKLRRLIGTAGAFDRFVADVRTLDLTADVQSQIAVIVRTAEADARLKTLPAEQAKVYTDAAAKILALLSTAEGRVAATGGGPEPPQRRGPAVRRPGPQPGAAGQGR